MTKLAYSTNLTNESGFAVFTPSLNVAKDLLRTDLPEPYAESITQLWPLGTKAVQGDRVWRYCKNSASALTVIGSSLQAPAGAHADTDEDIVVAASAGETYAIGSKTITITSTANFGAPWTTANAGKEGYISVNGGTGVGMCRKIKAHEASGGGTAAFTITVYDGWSVAPIAADTECSLAENPYSNVVVAAALTTMPVGVNPIAVTASYYFWSQTGGPASIQTNAAIPVGTMAICGTTAGKVDPCSAFTTEVIMGYMLTPGIKNTDAAIIFLTLDS